MSQKRALEGHGVFDRRYNRDTEIESTIEISSLTFIWFNDGCSSRLVRRSAFVLCQLQLSASIQCGRRFTASQTMNPSIILLKGDTIQDTTLCVVVYLSFVQARGGLCTLMVVCVQTWLVTLQP